MLDCFIQDSVSKPAIPLIFLDEIQFPAWLASQPAFTKNWIKTQQFSAKPETFCQVPSPQGQLAQVLIGQRHKDDVFYIGALPLCLPEGIFILEPFHPLAALAWGMGCYQFTPYKSFPCKNSRLFLPKTHTALMHELKAIYLIRDLINTPTEHMHPQALAEQAEMLAKQFGAQYHQIVGNALLKHHYPAIHAVGRASAHAPQLIDLRWGEKNASKVTLVGKGVCFDSGGLNIKNAQAMALMKKDMGGAAHVLGLAYLIMAAKLPVCLRVLIPAVENAISGNAYHPGDIIQTRKGLTVEIGNTDAEGRLILADALTEASREQPDLLIDIATLTGAAKVALGTELPALFTDDETLAQTLTSLSTDPYIQDPLWRMPLHMPYRKLLNSTFADINNMGNSPYAGAITAALFLKEFVTPGISWAHFDIMAWNVSASPAHPEGGEAQGIRVIFEYLKHRFCARSSAG